MNPDDAPIEMVVSLVPGRVIVWSISKLEGTISHPRLELRPASDGAWLARLRDDLAEVAQRRWAGRTRPEHQKTIILMGDASIASGDLVNAIAAVRHDAKGNPLFPDVRLSTGFDAAATAAAKQTDEDKAAAEAEERRQDAVALQEESAARFADLLTTDDSSGISDGDMAKRMPGSDLGAQIDAVRDSGNQVAVGGGAARGTRGDGDPRVGVGRGPTTIDGPVDDSAPRTPLGRISVASKTAIDDTSLTAEDVLRKIQSAYMMGLKRCYKEQLKTDPTVRGAATLAFTVNETGRTMNGTSTAMTPALGQCMEGLMANWRFPIPKDVDGESTEAAFRIKLQLVPD